jgi:hypothetical protein
MKEVHVGLLTHGGRLKLPSGRCAGLAKIRERKTLCYEFHSTHTVDGLFYSVVPFRSVVQITVIVITILCELFVLAPPVQLWTNCS